MFLSFHSQSFLSTWVSVSLCLDNGKAILPIFNIYFRFSAIQCFSFYLFSVLISFFLSSMTFFCCLRSLCSGVNEISISTACCGKSALYWFLTALCQGKQTKQMVRVVRQTFFFFLSFLISFFLSIYLLSIYLLSIYLLSFFLFLVHPFVCLFVCLSSVYFGSKVGPA
jgi:hypothetical protein